MTSQGTDADGDVAHLLQAQAAAEVLRGHGISLDEVCRGVPRENGPGAAEPWRLRAMEKERERLRATVAEQARTIEMLLTILARGW